MSTRRLLRIACCCSDALIRNELEFGLRSNRVCSSLQHYSSGRAFTLCMSAIAWNGLSKLPNLIIIDDPLSDMDVIELINELKSNAYVRPIPIVVLSTAAVDAARIDELYQNHITALVRKPLRQESLYQIVSILERYWMRTARLPAF